MTLGRFTLDQFVPAESVARNLSTVLSQLEMDESLVVTRRGKPVAVLLTTGEYERMVQAAQPAPMTRRHLHPNPAGDGGTWYRQESRDGHTWVTVDEIGPA